MAIPGLIITSTVRSLIKGLLTGVISQITARALSDNIILEMSRRSLNSDKDALALYNDLDPRVVYEQFGNDIIYAIEFRDEIILDGPIGGTKWNVRVPQFALKNFHPVTYSDGRDYRYNTRKTLTSGALSNSFDDTPVLRKLFAPVISYDASGSPGHVDNPLRLSPFQIADFSQLYPRTAQQFINRGSQLAETIVEIALLVPSMMKNWTKWKLPPLKKFSTYGSAYLAWELGIKPSFDSFAAASLVDIEDFSTMSSRGQHAYCIRGSDEKESSYQVQPIDGELKRSLFDLGMVGNAGSYADGARKSKGEVRNALIEGGVILSDCTLTLHLGDILGLSLFDQESIKHGAFKGTLAWALSPVSFFTDWFTHVFKNVLLQSDIEDLQHVFQGSYSSKTITMVPDKNSGSIVVSSAFSRVVFDPSSVPIAAFTAALEAWTLDNTPWRVSILLAILASRSKH